MSCMAGSRVQCAGGGGQSGEWSRGPLGPFWVQSKALIGGSGGEDPDGKRFSVFQNDLEGSHTIREKKP